jgi:phospholipase C
MSNALSAIQNVVVLMFENRSFDHIFGALPGVNGVLLPDGQVKPNLYNLPDPTQPPSATNVPVYSTGVDTAYKLPHDFNHDFGDGMMPDLFGPGTTGFVDGKPIGAPTKTYPATNSGFLSSTVFAASGQPQGPSAMTYFAYQSLQVLHTLADNFVVCDNWFCDMPGHTLPNRCFMHCATTGNVGIADNDSGTIYSPTIFQLIEGCGQTWKMYSPLSGQFDSYWLNDSSRLSPNTGISIEQFAADLKNGALPFYSFLMCWTDYTAKRDSSMHPASPLQPGENYLAAVYNALLASPYWQNTLLVVTFDENGGIYDHVVPLAAVQPEIGPPQTITNNYGTDSTFDFTLLGPRIPVLLISPWLAHGVDCTQYRNTSILRFLEDLLVPPTSPNATSVSLSSRDATATSIAEAFNKLGLTTPRIDCKPAEGYPGYIWYDGLENGPGPLTAEEAAEPPMPHLVDAAKMYLTGLPGHADSGKPITRTFDTVAELNSYAAEREKAAGVSRQSKH